MNNKRESKGWDRTLIRRISLMLMKIEGGLDQEKIERQRQFTRHFRTHVANQEREKRDIGG